MFKQILLSSKAAIDLASIMVGVIVIGLIGGVIAATVFAVIPWAQDSAAKQQLESIVAAQSAARGLTSDLSYPLPEKVDRNSFTNSEGLEKLGLLATNAKYCTVHIEEGQNYFAYAKSDSGRIWLLSYSQNKATLLADNDSPVAECSFLKESQPENPDSGSEPVNPPAPTIPEDPNRVVYGDTQFTLQCANKLTGGFYLPFEDATGTVQLVSNRNGQVVYTNEVSKASYTPVRFDLQQGEIYKFVFDGTFTGFHNQKENGTAVNNATQSSCFKSLDAWGTHSGTVNASYAMSGMQIAKVPASIPTTVTDLSYALQKAPLSGTKTGLSTWFTYNLDNLEGTFYDTNLSGVDLSQWNVSNVKNMRQLFAETNFNTSLSSWNVSNVQDMSRMFYRALSFNQPIGDWDTKNVTDMNNMFASASHLQGSATIAATSRFNQPINNWNVSNVQDMSRMFFGNQFFNQPLNNWNTQNVQNMSGMFSGFSTSASYIQASYSSYSIYNQDISSWNTGNVENFSEMFAGNKNFNQPIGVWDTKNAINMSYMFASRLFNANGFKQDLNNWNVGKVTNMNYMFAGSYYNAQKTFSNTYNLPLDKWNTSSVTSMSYMFYYSTYDQDISRWDTSKVRNMSYMFYGNTIYTHNLNTWEVNQMTNSVTYQYFASFPRAQWPLF